MVRARRFCWITAAVVPNQRLLHVLLAAPGQTRCGFHRSGPPSRQFQHRQTPAASHWPRHSLINRRWPPARGQTQLEALALDPAQTNRRRQHPELFSAFPHSPSRCLPARGFPGHGTEFVMVYHHHHRRRLSLLIR